MVTGLPGAGEAISVRAGRQRGVNRDRDECRRGGWRWFGVAVAGRRLQDAFQNHVVARSSFSGPLFVTARKAPRQSWQKMQE